MEDRFLVTGATGFVGACIVRELVKQKKHVSILARNKTLNFRLADISSQLNIFVCDLQDTALVRIIDKIKPDYIFHLAAFGAMSNEIDVETMIDVNIKGTYNFLNAVKKHKFKLFIYAGSSSEYGIKNKPMQESDLPEPVNDYAITKLSATLLCQKVAEKEKLPIIVFRLFSPYGYYEQKSRLVPSVILRALRNETIYLSNPKNVRDFIFIEDVVNAFIKATQMKNKPGEIYNVGSGKQHTIKEVVDIISSITKSRSKLAWGKVPKQARQLETKTWQADITKIKNDLGWQPEYRLTDGLIKAVDWFKTNRRFYEEK